MAGLELKEVDKGGEDVEEEAAEQHAVQAGCGEVLVDHQEVVPEVEEDLPWALCREAGTTDVVDDRGGGEGDAMPASIESPAQVDLLLMGEEDRIQPADLEIDVTADDEAGARCPEEIRGVSVLPVVLLERAEETATAEGIAQRVDEATSSTSVLEALRVTLCTDRRLDGSDRGVGVKESEGLIEPASAELDVAIEQDDRLVVQLGDGLVVARCEAVVLGEEVEAHLGIVLADEGHGVVRRAIVYDDEVCACGGVLHPRGEESLQEATAIPVEDEDGHLGVCGRMHSV